jgi:hypothetical protein
MPIVKAATLFAAIGTSYIRLFVLEELAPFFLIQTLAKLLVPVVFVIVKVETIASVALGTVYKSVSGLPVG